MPVPEPGPYEPGHAPTRGWQGQYNAYQELCWQAFDAVYFAHYFGRSDTLQPTPGKNISPKKFASWQALFEVAWSQESMRTTGSRGLKRDDLGENLMRHLYERFVRAKKG